MGGCYLRRGSPREPGRKGEHVNKDLEVGREASLGTQGGKHLAEGITSAKVLRQKYPRLAQGTLGKLAWLEGNMGGEVREGTRGRYRHRKDSPCTPSAWKPEGREGRSSVGARAF